MSNKQAGNGVGKRYGEGRLSFCKPKRQQIDQVDMESLEKKRVCFDKSRQPKESH